MLLAFLMYVCVLCPVPLLVFAWSRSNRKPIELSLLSLSAVLFLSAPIRSLKPIVLGTDYSHRLFATIEVNFFVAVALGFYLAIRRR